VPNFVAIGQTIADIWRFIFQNGGRRHLGFLKFEIFIGRRLKRVELRHRAKFRGDRSNRR